METNGHDHHSRMAPDNEEMGRLLTFIAEKWTLTVVSALLDGPQRFSSLRRMIPGVSQKMLTQTLRELERNGIVQRTIYPQVPPRVDYALTPLGATMCEPLSAFRRWIDTHRAEMDAAREAFEHRAETEEPISMPMRIGRPLEYLKEMLHNQRAA